MFEKITPDNVMMYAMKHYNNPQGDNEKEFLDDMKRFKYIKRLLRKYQDNGSLKERLILNHIIVDKKTDLGGPQNKIFTYITTDWYLSGIAC